MAESERVHIRERQREGIEKVKQKGRRLGSALENYQEDERKIFEMLGNDLHQTEVARRLNISRQTIYRALKA